MPVPLDRDQVRNSADAVQAQLVEVLPRSEYDWAHLPEAIHLPPEQLNAEAAVTALDRVCPVIICCNDYQRDLARSTERVVRT